MAPRRSPAAFCVGPQRSVSGSSTLSLSMLGPGTLCVGARRSLCRVPALSRTLCAGPPCSLCRAPPLFRCLCRAPALSRTLCVGARHPLCGCGALCARGSRLLCHPCGQAPMRCAGAGPSSAPRATYSVTQWQLRSVCAPIQVPPSATYPVLRAPSSDPLLLRGEKQTAV